MTRPSASRPSAAAGPEAVGTTASAGTDAPGPAAARGWTVFAQNCPTAGTWAGLCIAGALCAGVVGYLSAGSPAVGAFCLFAAAAPLLSAVDLAEHRLPDLITLPLAAGCALAVLFGAVAAEDLGLLGSALAGGAGLAAVFGLLFCLGGGSGFGFGDVKLGLSMGLCLGALSPWAVFAGAFTGFVLAGIAGLIVLLAGRGTPSTAIPLGPFLLTGTLIVVIGAQ